MSIVGRQPLHSKEVARLRDLLRNAEAENKQLKHLQHAQEALLSKIQDLEKTKAELQNSLAGCGEQGGETLNRVADLHSEYVARLRADFAKDVEALAAARSARRDAEDKLREAQKHVRELEMKRELCNEYLRQAEEEVKRLANTVQEWETRWEWARIANEEGELQREQAIARAEIAEIEKNRLSEELKAIRVSMDVRHHRPSGSRPTMNHRALHHGPVVDAAEMGSNDRETVSLFGRKIVAVRFGV